MFKKNNNEHFVFLTGYMKLARRLGRFETAMKKAQEALTIAYKLKKLSKVNEVRYFMETLVFIDTNKNVMTSAEHYEKFGTWIERGLFDMKMPREIIETVEKVIRLG